MSKEAYYFSHDSNARNDDKILELRAAYGWEGYGLYWALVETLRDSSEYKYSLERLGGLALSLSVEKDKMRKVIDACIDLGLFAEKEGFFYSESLLKRMQLRDAKSQKAREAIKKRWEKSKSDTDVIQTYQHGDTDELRMNYNANTIKGKESKGKESKGKEKKIKESKVKEIVFPFDSEKFIDAWNFWKDYKKTQHKESYKSSATEQIVLKKLAELSGGDESAAIKIIEQSISNTWKGLFPLKNLAKNENRNSKTRGYNPDAFRGQEINDWINSVGKD